MKFDLKNKIITTHFYRMDCPLHTFILSCSTGTLKIAMALCTKNTVNMEDLDNPFPKTIYRFFVKKQIWVQSLAEKFTKTNF